MTISELRERISLSQEFEIPGSEVLYKKEDKLSIVDSLLSLLGGQDFEIPSSAEEALDQFEKLVPEDDFMTWEEARRQSRLLELVVAFHRWEVEEV